jgi:hypothetical protein
MTRSIIVRVALLVLPAQATAAASECPASLVLLSKGMTAPDVAAAQRYADCLSFPWLPTSEQLARKIEKCAVHRPRNRSRRLIGALSWVEHMVRQLPTCETRLEIKSK